MIRGILLDIEGTTTPVSVVYDVLFPYARRHMAEHVRNAVFDDLEEEHEQDLRNGNNPPPLSSDPVPYLFWLMDKDRKSTALKRIQGEIWLKGFNEGELRGEVFDDVAPALRRWHAKGIDIRIFSSGSVVAQRLVFSTTPSGNLTQYIRGYFDTQTGAKDKPDSYRIIAATFGLPAGQILFLSDIAKELDAARSAGMQTRLCLRPGNRPQPEHNHETIKDFQTDHSWPWTT
jgi:enolase-phosphatase E1